MKLSGFLLPALAGLAAADKQSQQEAQAYVLQQGRTTSSSNPPSIPAGTARSILLQRLSQAYLSDSIDDESVSYINQFGKTTPPLFSAVEKGDDPHQLVVVYKGASNDAFAAVKKSLSNKDATFTTPGLEYLPSADLPSTFKTGNCAYDIGDAKTRCSGKLQYLEVDLAAEPKAIKFLTKQISKLQKLADSNELETTILLLPPSGAPDELRRRAIKLEDVRSEQVLTETSGASSTASTASSSDSKAEDTSFKPLPFVQTKKPIPACFQSYNACETATNNCSGHGLIKNRHGEASADKCFACQCLASIEGNSTYHWGGNACQKIDVSTPFWLLAGFTVLMVSVVGMCIGMLFSVGQEKLPGVIGAGVSRSK